MNKMHSMLIQNLRFLPEGFPFTFFDNTTLCHCLDLECLQDILCWGFVMKKVLVTERLW